MFGKRSGSGQPQASAPVGPAAETIVEAAPAVPVLSDMDVFGLGSGETRGREPVLPIALQADTRKSEEYYQTKSMIFGALIEAIDLAQLSRLDGDAAREEIRDIV